MKTPRLIKAYLLGVSYKVSATESPYITEGLLSLLEHANSEVILGHFSSMDANKILLCLYELYAHGETVKLLQLWREDSINTKVRNLEHINHPLSLKGLMLRTLVTYLEMEI